MERKPVVGANVLPLCQRDVLESLQKVEIPTVPVESGCKQRHCL